MSQLHHSRTKKGTASNKSRRHSNTNMSTNNTNNKIDAPHFTPKNPQCQSPQQINQFPHDSTTDSNHNHHHHHGSSTILSQLSLSSQSPPSMPQSFRDATPRSEGRPPSANLSKREDNNATTSTLIVGTTTTIPLVSARKLVVGSKLNAMDAFDCTDAQLHNGGDANNDDNDNNAKDANDANDGYKYNNADKNNSDIDRDLTGGTGAISSGVSKNPYGGRGTSRKMINSSSSSSAKQQGKSEGVAITSSSSKVGGVYSSSAQAITNRSSATHGNVDNNIANNNPNTNHENKIVVSVTAVPTKSRRTRFPHFSSSLALRRMSPLSSFSLNQQQQYQHPQASSNLADKMGNVVVGSGVKKCNFSLSNADNIKKDSTSKVPDLTKPTNTHSSTLRLPSTTTIDDCCKTKEMNGNKSSAKNKPSPSYTIFSFSQNRMQYSDSFFATSTLISTRQAVENDSSSSASHYSSEITAKIRATTVEEQSVHQPTTTAYNPQTSPGWRAFTGVTEFGFDCFATPAYVVHSKYSTNKQHNQHAILQGEGNVGRKFDGGGCIGWGSDGSVIRGGIVSSSISKPSSSPSSPPPSSPPPTSSLPDANFCGAITSSANAASAAVSLASEENQQSKEEETKARVISRPPGHIYALREIMMCSTLDVNDTCPLGQSTEMETYGTTANCYNYLKQSRTPRIITSRVVCTSENVYHHLESSSAGTVLCPAWRKEDSNLNLSIKGHIFNQVQSRDDPFFYSTGLMPSDAIAPMESDKRPPGKLLLVTVPSSEIKKQVGEDNSMHVGCANELEDNLRQDEIRVQLTGESFDVACNNTREVAIKDGNNSDFLVGKNQKTSIDEGCKHTTEKKSTCGLSRKLLKSMRWLRRRKKSLTCGNENDTTSKSPIFFHGDSALGGVVSGDTPAANNFQGTPLKNTHIPTAISYATPTHGSQPQILSSIFCDDAVIKNNIDPIEEIVCISQSLGIYVSESGLSASECRHIIEVSEKCAESAQGWSSYTYAKQTLGCRENDPLAFVSRDPVMRACATIKKHLVDHNGSGNRVNAPDDEKQPKPCILAVDSKDDCDKDITNVSDGVGLESARPNRKKDLVLDAREPHVVKYDLSKKERQKLDMHTDKSVWTFLIALSEGRGFDYGEGGTFFEAMNSTVHLQRGQMLIFRGKLRHKGVKISHGSRYLLVGFLVERKCDAHVKQM